MPDMNTAQSVSSIGSVELNPSNTESVFPPSNVPLSVVNRHRETTEVPDWLKGIDLNDERHSAKTEQPVETIAPLLVKSEVTTIEPAAALSPEPHGISKKVGDNETNDPVDSGSSLDHLRNNDDEEKFLNEVNKKIRRIV